MIAEPFKDLSLLLGQLLARRLIAAVSRLVSVRLESTFSLDAGRIDELLALPPPQGILIEAFVFGHGTADTGGHLLLMNLLRHFANLRFEAEPVQFFA